VRRAIGWYRTHDRVHCGDPITMATDALAAYKADTAIGKDALLVCDTTEMADALNQRIHHDTIAVGSPTVTGARGQRIAVGDLILSRQNDTSIPVRNSDEPAAEDSPVRNGNRWCVTAINPDDNRLIARRLDDNTLAAFSDDYVREHITHGYAVTVHSAQGVTADTTHAVLSDTATRALLYVAISRGRDTNSAYLYQRTTEYEYPHEPTDARHVMQRGSGQAAGQLLRAIVANNDEQPVTAHDMAAQSPDSALSERVRSLVDRRVMAVQRRRATLQSWQAEAQNVAVSMDGGHDRRISQGRELGVDCGMEL
jgi:hypothetical protein